MTSSNHILKLCLNKCGFYGCSNREHLCSKCFKEKYPVEHKNNKKRKIEKITMELNVEEKQMLPKLKKIKCSYDECKKKIDLVSQYPCKCGNIYCKYHKFTLDHSCTYNYKKVHEEKLKKENPEIKGKKINFLE